ncbi:MAG: L-histidine N(alpha)-methyltransferase [Calothrix sp. C42_A2020_038]|nr:L-histidine N(alpha)-methyltransferase [Calothrix sp. C42_A2020_038]
MADKNNLRLKNQNHSITNNRIAKPSSEFYTVFSQKELLNLIEALKTRREIPLKYSYKGYGANIWDNFYRKLIIPNWYRSNVEIKLLRDNFKYLNGKPQNCHKVNIVDVGAGNSYPVKDYIRKLDKLSRINRYIALDISEELLEVSKRNFTKWFPFIKYTNSYIDIENSPIPEYLLYQDGINIFLHLGVTIGNLQHRVKALQNFRQSMHKHDLLVLTNEIGYSSQWDGIARGGCYYHAEQIYRGINSNIGIPNQYCELIRKYDKKTDSVVANMKFLSDYTIDFSSMGINRKVEISKDEEITIWRHHKHQIPELIQEIGQAGLQLVHYSTNKYQSHIMVICKVK